MPQHAKSDELAYIIISPRFTTWKKHDDDGCMHEGSKRTEGHAKFGDNCQVPRATYPNKLLERCWSKWIEKNSIRITPRLVGGAKNPALSGSKQIWVLVLLPSTQRVAFKANMFWCNKLFSSTRRFKLCTRTFGTRVTSWNWRDLGCSPATASTVPPVTNSSGHLPCRQQALMTSANQCCFLSSTIYNLMWCLQISLGKASLLSASAFLRRTCFFWRLECSVFLFAL